MPMAKEGLALWDAGVPTPARPATFWGTLLRQAGSRQGRPAGPDWAGLATGQAPKPPPSFDRPFAALRARFARLTRMSGGWLLGSRRSLIMLIPNGRSDE